MNRPCCYLALKAHTWPAHNEELFDYTARNLVTDTYKVASDYYLARVGDHVRPVTSLSDYTDGSVLARIIHQPTYFSVISDHNCTSDGLWLSAKFMKERSCELAVGSVLRFGEVTLETLEAGWDSEEEQPAREDLEPPLLGPDEGCRICYSDRSSQDDPLLSPCLCTGTMRFIHLKCLHRSLSSSISVRETSQVLTFQWKELKCRVCQSQFDVQLPGKRLAVPVPHTSKPHIIMKATAPDFHALYLITPEHDAATIGRSHDCDIVFSFPSVSRLHAKVKFDDNRFIMQDCESRFGTIVKVDHFDFQRREEVVGLQIGKTMITFKAGQ